MGGEIYAKMEFTTHTISSLGAKFLYFCYSYNSCNNLFLEFWLVHTWIFAHWRHQTCCNSPRKCTPLKWVVEAKSWISICYIDNLYLCQHQIKFVDFHVFPIVIYAWFKTSQREHFVNILWDRWCLYTVSFYSWSTST